MNDVEAKPSLGDELDQKEREKHYGEVPAYDRTDLERESLKDRGK